jgi:enoyl-CoA hydratase/carnithine racemase
VRTTRSPALDLRRVAERLVVHVHGAAVGAGVEWAAVGARVVARHDATFRLPEVAMGLVPGAGGASSVPRRIGRHRATWMALTGAEVDAPTALAWGLVDEVVEADVFGRPPV